MAKVHGESKLTFLESTSIIIGHGVGSGILSVPFLASRNNWHDIIWIAALAYCMNLLLHFMIAELSLNNNGAQFIKCFENELFVGKLKMACTWLAFGLLGFSVVVNVSGFITGAAAVFSAWFHLPSVVGMLLFYVLAASVVQVLTGVGVIVAYNRSRKRAGTSLICGRLGSLPFQILAVAASLVASVGAVLTVTV